MLAPLVSTTDATQLGFTVSEAALKRASIRVRGYLDQMVSVKTGDTITARSPVFRLPERPVTNVTSVLDDTGAPLSYERNGADITILDDYAGMVTVTYDHGIAELPDELVELICQIASRLDGQDSSSALAQGVQQQTAGPFTQSLGWDAWKAQAGLTQGEMDTLDRYWPTVPRPLSMGSPA